MEVIIHKAETRGHFNYGWLDTWHTFSFARYYDQRRLNFGALRVLNDDVIKPKQGFGRHPHDNMEIITIPISGRLLHRDSIGHEEIINTGEIQVMSAGTGIFHEEYNADKKEDINLLQIWIYPNKENIEPCYDQKPFDRDPAIDKWQKLVSSSEDNTLHINQNAIISRVFLTQDKALNYIPDKDSYGNYLFVISGEIKINEVALSARDGLGIINKGEFTITSKTNSYVLNLEVPK